MPNFMLGGNLFRFIIFIFSRDCLLFNANINKSTLLIFSNDDFVTLFLIKYMYDDDDQVVKHKIGHVNY